MNRGINERNMKKDAGSQESSDHRGTDSSGKPGGTIRNRDDLRREVRALPGEILRDFASTVGFWMTILFFCGILTGLGAWVGYVIGEDSDGAWLGAAIMGGVSPILVGFMLVLNIPRRIWRRITGRKR
ncbi:hypothetical protein [Saccharibacillus endophyticus]|uniref:DUF4282 domain-containing protein n=1 Tax=Saccharibacillus endophyticus TaxID=2060666 RepID=A0ABQ1ZQ21_9BACL|nr:hypothetical protein [Saccharibacillus endophyticus]GGH74310.1 hypothetical protein GCM10007362_14270 [Saccharibacillus endophyticus]